MRRLALPGFGDAQQRHQASSSSHASSMSATSLSRNIELQHASHGAGVIPSRSSCAVELRHSRSAACSRTEVAERAQRAPSRAARASPKLFAPFDLRVQERRWHRGARFADLDAAQLQQMARPQHRCLQRAIGLVGVRREFERPRCSAGVPTREPVGMNPARQRPVGQVELVQRQRETRLQIEQREIARRQSRGRDASYRETLAAAALRLAVGVVELEALVQPFAHEIQFRSLEVRQEFRVPRAASRRGSRIRSPRAASRRRIRSCRRVPSSPRCARRGAARSRRRAYRSTAAPDGQLFPSAGWSLVSPLSAVENELPQPQVLFALGFLMTKREPSAPSWKSIFGAAQILQTDRVDQHAHAVLFDDEIVRIAQFLERESVLESRAAAAGDRDAQHQVGVAFLEDQIAHLRDGIAAEAIRALGGSADMATPIWARAWRGSRRSRP